MKDLLITIFKVVCFVGTGLWLSLVLCAGMYHFSNYLGHKFVEHQHIVVDAK